MFWTTPITYNIALLGISYEQAPLTWFSDHWLSYHGGFEQISTDDKRIQTYTISHQPDAGQWAASITTTSILGVFKA